jgi:superfamily II DNA or RNA helicase
MDAVLVRAEVLAATSKATDAEICIEGLTGELRPFQRAGVAYALEARRTFIADEMGLGKTLQALATCQAADAFPALIVCPASLRLNWQREARKWLPGRSTAVLSGKRPIAVPRADIVIINYDILAAWQELLLRTAWQAVVYDESHMLKSSSAARTKAAKAIAKGRPVVLCLSGTPLVNRPAELITQLQIMNRLTDLGGWGYFAKRFCRGFKGRFGWDLSGSANLDELNEKLRRICYVRRLKRDVLTELPPKVRVEVPVEIDNRDEYMQAARDVKRWLQDQVDKDQEFLESIAHLSAAEQAKARGVRRSDVDAKARKAEELVRINALKRLAARGKLAAAKQWIADFLESGEKLIVFVHHIDIAKALAGEFKAPIIIGETAMETRQAAVDRFQNDPTCNVIVLNLAAGGVGLTLTAASNVAFVELGWTPGGLDQCEDRCVLEGQHVITKRGPVLIEKVTTDDHVLSMDGGWHRVKDVWSRLARTGSGPRRLTEVRCLRHNESLTVTDDHLVFARRDSGVSGWVPAVALRPGDEVAMPRLRGAGVPSLRFPDERRLYSDEEISRSSACSVCGSEAVLARGLCSRHYSQLRYRTGGDLGEIEYRAPNGRAHRMPDEVTVDERFLRLVGWYLAEGFSSIASGKGRFVSLAGHENERSILEGHGQYLAEVFGINWSIYTTATSARSTKGIELRAYSAELAFWFHAMFGHLAQNKRLPEWMFDLTPHQAETVLQSYIDGDGYRRRATSVWVSASRDVAYGMAVLAASAGYLPGVRVGSEQSGAHFVGGYTLRDDEPYAWAQIRETRTYFAPRGSRVWDLSVEDDPSFVIGMALVHNCHRIGQTDSVTAWYLLGEDTIDQDIYALIEEKRAVVTAATDGEIVIDEGSMLNELLGRIAA